MRNFLALAMLAAVGGFTWNLGATVDDTFVALIVGIFIGALAGLPGGLIALVATRRNERNRGWEESPPPRPRARYADAYDDRPMLIMQPQQQQPAPQQPQPQQPQANPWVVTGGGSFNDMPAPQQDGRFRVN